MLRSGAGCLGSISTFATARASRLTTRALFASTHDARVDASRALAEMVKGAMPDGPRTAMAREARGEKSGGCRFELPRPPRSRALKSRRQDQAALPRME